MYDNSDKASELSNSSQLRCQHRGQLDNRISEDTLVARSESEETLIDRNNMATPNGNVEVERRRSFGIGGAGNIRL